MAFVDRVRETLSVQDTAPYRHHDGERPMKDVVRDIVQESQHLVREEVRLAKAELRDEAKRVGKGAGAMGAAGVFGHVALLCFAGCLIAALAGGMKRWVAALLTTLLFAAVAAGLFFWGKQRVQNLKPEQTLRTLEEDRRWMKDTMQRVKSPNPGNA